MASGGATTAGTDVMGCQFSLADFRLLVVEAHAAGLPVTTHAHGLPALEQAVKAGVDGIGHCWAGTTDTSPTPAELISMQPPQRLGMTLEKLLKQVGRVHRTGVRLVAGTDGGIAATKPHCILPAAIAEMVADPFSDIHALTQTAAVMVRRTLGRLRRGPLHDEPKTS